MCFPKATYSSLAHELPVIPADNHVERANVLEHRVVSRVEEHLARVVPRLLVLCLDHLNVGILVLRTG